MALKEHLTAGEAAAQLGVSPATLYAYVSRGLIRSEASPGARRQRLYRREDIDMLNNRKEARRNPTQAAERGLSWGLPVLESGLTLISDGRLYYRGLDATHLAATRSVEEVASLMWMGEIAPGCAELFARAAATIPGLAAMRVKLPELAPIERFQVILALAEREDPGAYDFTPGTLVETGARIVTLLAAIVAPRNQSAGAIARTLQSAWLPRDPGAQAVLSAALILLIDHELAVSSFTARCVASASSTLYAVVAAGLCALRGVKHGGATERAEEFLREAASARKIREVVASRLRRGELIPGFGHPLYPAGDPRARALLELLMRRYPHSPAISLARSIMKEVRRVSDAMLPNIDLAVALLARTLRLPEGSAITIFALGRTIGWIGHALEQYRIDRLIRPRARYVGPAPARQR
ncbi:MAG TPA: citrate/2-methylcitrate synthase [Candidatus Binataceae bacterium]|nr:citrate/2-methylcitrate synthase [Candidatus Binataceae bacterium]